MSKPIEIYLEIGRKLVFAGALEWPGWCRAGRGEVAALERLQEYRSRYAGAIAGTPYKLPASQTLTVAQKLSGDSTTDFGAPSISPDVDDQPLTPAELRRQTVLLNASWTTFDAAAKKAARVSLETGPRGGGRQVSGMIDHVYEADRAYLSKLGRPFKRTFGEPSVSATGTRASKHVAAMRSAFLEAIEARHNDGPDLRKRATSKVWTARYAIRRSAWHALDHAWEIEDRSQGATPQR
ncbi:MAG: hypothetical protein NVSMB57_11280 [Actinomycetota bacterium]